MQTGRVRVVVEKISGMGGSHYAGKGGGEISSRSSHWTRSYFGEPPTVGDFIAFGDESPSVVTQVRVVPAEWQENYMKPPTMIDPKTAWCLCRESLAPRHGETVRRVANWEDGLSVGVI